MTEKRREYMRLLMQKKRAEAANKTANTANKSPMKNANRRVVSNRAPGPPVWAEWIEINRAAGRADPAPLGPDTAASRNLGQAVPDKETRLAMMKRFLMDRDEFLVRCGHALRHIGQRVNAYLNPGVKPKSEWTDDDYIQALLDENAREGAEKRRQMRAAGMVEA